MNHHGQSIILGVVHLFVHFFYLRKKAKREGGWVVRNGPHMEKHEILIMQILGMKSKVWRKFLS